MNDTINYENIIETIDVVINGEYAKKVLEDRPLNIYWGTTPSAIPNLNYLLPLMQICNFLNNNCNIKILLADIHAYLDSAKSNFEVLEIRTNIHEKIIKMLINYLNYDTTRIKFIQGTALQLGTDYTMDVYRFNKICTVSKLKKAGENAVQQSSDPLMTSLLYPTLQALDIEHLECDVFFGDINQKEICLLGNEVFEKLGYKKRTYFLNEIYDSLQKIEKIYVIDSYQTIKRKINNTSLELIINLLYLIILELCKLKNISLKINNYDFKTIEEIKEYYDNKKINDIDIKNAISDFIVDMFHLIRKEFIDDDNKYQLEKAQYLHYID
jgi:tyrosyl-tRNA synthetase